jgi:hypothetical protein
VPMRLDDGADDRRLINSCAVKPHDDEPWDGPPAPRRHCWSGSPHRGNRSGSGLRATLDQRISVRYALAGMSAAETGDYITHTSSSPAAPTLFSADAVTLIRGVSRGYPRTVNASPSTSHRRVRPRRHHRRREGPQMAICETGADRRRHQVRVGVVEGLMGPALGYMSASRSEAEPLCGNETFVEVPSPLCLAAQQMVLDGESGTPGAMSRARIACSCSPTAPSEANSS